MNDAELLDFFKQKYAGHDYNEQVFTDNINLFSLADDEIVINFCGCEYRGCNFCTHSKDNGLNYIPIEKLKQIILGLNIPSIGLSGSNLNSYPDLVELYDWLEENNITITKIRGLTPAGQVARDILDKASLLGPDAVAIRIMAGSDRMLEAMGANFTVQDIETAISLASSAGNKVSLHVLCGYPGDAQDNIDGINSLIQYNNCQVCLCRFNPPEWFEGSAMDEQEMLDLYKDFKEIDNLYGENTKYWV